MQTAVVRSPRTGERARSSSGSRRKRRADASVNPRKLRLDQLQEAIRANQVSFPSQIPVFIKHSRGAQQCHMVLLYFVRGWSCEKIAQRYHVTRQHIWQIVSEWRRHAVTLGYIQAIPPAETSAAPALVIR